MHEQTAQTQISLDNSHLSESLPFAWTNAQADLSLFGLQLSHFIGLKFYEFDQIYGNDNRNDKNYDIK